MRSYNDTVWFLNGVPYIDVTVSFALIYQMSPDKNKLGIRLLRYQTDVRFISDQFMELAPVNLVVFQIDEFSQSDLTSQMRYIKTIRIIVVFNQ